MKNSKVIRDSIEKRTKLPATIHLILMENSKVNFLLEREGMFCVDCGLRISCYNMRPDLMGLEEQLRLGQH